LTAKRTVDCRCKQAQSIVNSRSQEPGYFQNPPTAAGPHAPECYLGLGLPRSDDWTRIPVARVRGPSRFLVPTSSAFRYLRDGSAMYCYSPMRAH